MISTGTLPGFEPVPLRRDDVDALVLTHEMRSFADDDPSRSLNDDPTYLPFELAALGGQMHL